jgi:hypothetical protein
VRPTDNKRRRRGRKKKEKARKIQKPSKKLLAV